MFFLNLTAGEFLALLGALSGFITALYLLDRAKRKKVVSTLRFWTSAITADEKQIRRRMRDPWSLVLQLVSLALLLLSIAQLQWGTRERKERDHVLLLDTSAWSGALEAGTQKHRSLVIDREKNLAASYISALPAHDRVMLVLADALATPVTPFTADRTQLAAAVRSATPGFSALDIDQALSYARQAQTWSGGQPGEIVYIGPKQIDASESATNTIPNLRILSVPSDRENAGISQISVKRGENAEGEWQASITVKNYGSARHAVRLNTRFGATVFAPRILNLGPQQETVVEYVFVTNAEGQFVAELDQPDALAADNTVTLALPRNGLLRVAVYSARPAELRPLIEANPRLSARFYDPSQYQPKPPADIMLLDRVTPPNPPVIPSLWIQPSRDASPLPVKTVVKDALITNWNSNTALSNGLHAKETHLNAAEVFETFDSDLPIASVSEGPVVVARPALFTRPKLAVLGFDPLAGGMKFQVTTPLLFANLFHWLSPESLRTLEISAARVGAATITLDPAEHADQLRVTTNSGDPVPFTIHGRSMQLFTDRPGIVRIASYDRERVLSLTLPHVAEHEWKPPVAAPTVLPARSAWTSNSWALWQWLAVLGGIGLLTEWSMFGRRRAAIRRSTSTQSHERSDQSHERSDWRLVSQ